MKLLTLVFCLLVLLAGSQWLSAAESEQSSPACKPVEKNPERHEQFMKDKQQALEKGPIQIVFIGDSITDGWRNGEQKKLFDERWDKYNPYNIGISGDQTQHVLWRIDHGELDGVKAKLAVVMIGTNNLGAGMSVDDAAAGIRCVVSAIQEKMPDAKILLLAVFPRGQKADDPFRDKIKQVNESIAKLDDGGKHVKYLDIGERFLDESGTLPPDVMPDALHPNLKGYHIWANAIGQTVEEMMKD